MKFGISGEQATAISPVKQALQPTNAITAESHQDMQKNIEEEAEKIKAEYEHKLAQMQKKFDEEQGNKKRLGKFSANVFVKNHFFSAATFCCCLVHPDYSENIKLAFYAYKFHQVISDLLYQAHIYFYHTIYNLVCQLCSIIKVLRACLCLFYTCNIF